MSTFITFSLTIFRQWPKIVVFLIFVAAAIAKWQLSTMPDEASIPAPPQPTQNARTYFDTANRMIVERLDRVHPRSYFNKPVTAQQLNDPNGGYYSPAIRTINRLVAENKPVFEEIDMGLTHQFCALPQRSYFVADNWYGGITEYSRLVRCLEAAEYASAASGAWNTAMDYDLDAINVGADLSHGACLQGMWYATSCEMGPRESSENLIDHLTSHDAEADVLRVAKIQTSEVSPTMVLRDEEWDQQGSLVDAFNKHKWDDVYDNTNATEAWNSPINTYDIAQWDKFSAEKPRRIYDAYTSYMDQVIELSKQRWPKLHSDALIPLPPEFPNKLINGEYTFFIARDLTELAFDRMLEIQLALHAYQLDNGHYPDALQVLEPAYLPTMPTDPFSDNQSLKYRLNPKGYVLYSIGPDAIDDGGNPICDPKMKRLKYLVYSDQQTGDIVAGVNE